MPRFSRALLGAGVAFCLLSSGAHAQNAAPDSPIPVPEQPPTQNAPTQNAPTTNAPTTNAPTQNAPTQNAPTQNAARATPEERRQQTENKLRALMANLGISATPTQDSIIDYLADDELERAKLREAEKNLLAGLRRDVPPERMRDLLGDYRAAIETDKANRVQAQRRLDARVGYSLDSRLEATLWLMGVLGDGASKLPTNALSARKTDAPAPDAPATNETAPVYGPIAVPNFSARGEIVGTVNAKGVDESGAHWLEIRDDGGASERYSAWWRDDLKALDAPMEKQLTETPLGARVRVQWAWQDKRRALQLQAEDAPQTVTKVETP